jgi:hypothetical protein
MAVLALAVVFGGGGGATVALLRHQRTVLAGPATPFRPDSLVGVGPDGRPVRVPSRASVLLYVSARCAFCKAELRAWSRFLDAHPAARPPWVVFAPGTGVRDARALVTAFADRWMTDPTGAVGRSLRVEAVPMLVVFDSAGAVVEAHVGMSPPERLELLAELSSRTPRSRP